VALVGLVLVGTPLAIGGMPVSVLVVSSGLAVLGALALLFGLGTARARALLGHPGLAALVLGLCWTAFQALPLPCDLVAALAPMSAEAVEAARDAWSGPDRPEIACTVSRAPGGTLREVVRGAALLAVFLSAALLALVGRRRIVYSLVAVSVVALAVASLGHLILDAERVWGLYTPRFARTTSVPGPVLNANSLAGMLVLGAPLLLAFGLEERRRRLPFFAASVLLLGLVVLTLSRGGIAAAVFVALAFPALGVFRRRPGTTSEPRGGRPWSQQTAVVGAGLVAAGGLAAGVWATAGGLEDELARQDLTKLELIAAAGAFALTAPTVGVGKGAFSTSFVEFYGVRARFEHAENFVAQWLAEWGFPVGIGILGLLALAMLRGLRRAEHRVDLAVWAGLAALTLQNLVDLGFEVPGVSLVAVAALGAVSTDRPRLHAVPSAAGRRRPRRLPRPHPVLFPALATLVVACFAVAAPVVLRVGRDRVAEERLARAVRSGDGPAATRILAEVIPWYPSEPSLYLLAGSRAMNVPDAGPLRMLNRAMTLAPGWAAPRVEAARWLWAFGRRDQALLELQQAAARDVSVAAPLLCALLERAPAPDLVDRALPRDDPDAREATLVAAAECVPERSPAALEIALRLVRQAPGYCRGHLFAGRRSMSAGVPQRESLAHFEAARRCAPDAVWPIAALGEALGSLGRHEEARAILEEGTRRFPEAAGLWEALARVEAAADEDEAMREAYAAFLAAQPVSGRALGRANALLSDLEATAGNHRRALAAAREAYRFEEDPSYLARVAKLAQRLDAPRLALDAFLTLCEDHGGWQGACRKAEAIRRAGRDAERKSSVPHRNQWNGPRSAATGVQRRSTLATQDEGAPPR